MRVNAKIYGFAHEQRPYVLETKHRMNIIFKGKLLK